MSLSPRRFRVTSLAVRGSLRAVAAFAFAFGLGPLLGSGCGVVHMDEGGVGGGGGQMTAVIGAPAGSGGGTGAGTGGVPATATPSELAGAGGTTHAVAIVADSGGAGNQGAAGSAGMGDIGNMGSGGGAGELASTGAAGAAGDAGSGGGGAGAPPDGGEPVDATADLLPPPPDTRDCTVKINEIQTGGASGLDEFVELYNTCPDREVDLKGYTLLYRSATGTTDFTRVAFMTSIMHAGHPFFVCANGDYAGAADVRYTEGLAATGGGVALRAPDGRIVDAVAWGNASNAFVEGSPAIAPGAGLSIVRVPDGHDSGDNAADFVVRTAVTTPGAAN